MITAVHILKKFSHHAQSQETLSAARIMQMVRPRFDRRRGSLVSIHQADNVREFNLYYNFRVRCAAA